MTTKHIETAAVDKNARHSLAPKAPLKSGASISCRKSNAFIKLKLSVQLTANPSLAHQKSAATTTDGELRKAKNSPHVPHDAHQRSGSG